MVKILSDCHMGLRQWEKEEFFVPIYIIFGVDHADKTPYLKLLLSSYHSVVIKQLHNNMWWRLFRDFRTAVNVDVLKD